MKKKLSYPFNEIYENYLLSKNRVDKKNIGKHWDEFQEDFEKVILNMGLGLDGNDKKVLKSCTDDLSLIAGQKPVITKFRKSIANFKTRKNTNSGLKVTLRKNKILK